MIHLLLLLGKLAASIHELVKLVARGIKQVGTLMKRYRCYHEAYPSAICIRTDKDGKISSTVRCRKCGKLLKAEYGLQLPCRWVNIVYCVPAQEEDDE